MISVTTETFRNVNKSVYVRIFNFVLGLYFIDFIGYVVLRYHAMSERKHGKTHS